MTCVHHTAETSRKANSNHDENTSTSILVVWTQSFLSPTQVAAHQDRVVHAKAQPKENMAQSLDKDIVEQDTEGVRDRNRKVPIESIIVSSLLSQEEAEIYRRWIDS